MCVCVCVSFGRSVRESKRFLHFSYVLLFLLLFSSLGFYLFVCVVIVNSSFGRNSQKIASCIYSVFPRFYFYFNSWARHCYLPISHTSVDWHTIFTTTTTKKRTENKCYVCVSFCFSIQIRLAFAYKVNIWSVKERRNERKKEIAKRKMKKRNIQTPSSKK